MLKQNSVHFAKLAVLTAFTAYIFSACSKSNSVHTGPQLPANAIRTTTLNGGNVKGTMLADSTYTINGDLTVLPSDTLTIQAGATVNVTGNHAFYIQGIIQSLGTSSKPIVFTSTVSQTPGQWGGFQCDSAKAVTFLWTKVLWAGGPDSSGGTRQTIGVSSPIPVDIEDCWFIGGQDNSIGVYSTATVKILRNTMLNNGTTDGDCIDFHSGVMGTVAYNCIWSSAGSAIKVYTSQTVPTAETNVTVFNNTCVEAGFRRGAGEPGRGILVDAFSKGNFYNNLLVNNYWSLDITPSADVANCKYGNNFFHVTLDSLRQFMYPAGELGVIQTTDIIDSVHLGANDPKFVNYTTTITASRVSTPNNLDFRLQSTSPALGKGSTSFPGASGAAVAPSSDIGAYVSDTSNGKGNRHGPGW